MGFELYSSVVSLILMRDLTGNEHKKQRKLIDPIFSAARISKLTPLFYQVANQASLLLLNLPVAGLLVLIFSCDRPWQRRSRHQGPRSMFWTT
jgi:cytochrome P450